MPETKNVVSAGIFRVQNGRWRILYRDKNRDGWRNNRAGENAGRELLTQWHKAKNLIRGYNQTDLINIEGKNRILHSLLGGHGKDLWITPPFFVDCGNNCEINRNGAFLDDNKRTAGDNAPAAPDVQIDAAFHPVNAAAGLEKPEVTVSLHFAKPRQLP